MKTPIFSIWRKQEASSRRTLNPGMLSSLSSVPPVIPSPRPETIGTHRPSQARRGARTSETLSPMPPVECLSTFGGDPSGHWNTLPLSRMAAVRADVSSSDMP